MCELWRKLNSKEEEILILREKIRDLERNQVPLDLTQTVSCFIMIIINCHLFTIVLELFHYSVQCALFVSCL